MKLKITIALTIFTLYLFGQQTNKITVPAMYSTHKMKYFIVEEFQTKHKEFEIYDPTNILEEIYSKDNLINLSNTRYTEWPFEAREFPERILFVETTIDKVGKCARLQLIERDFNKNILKIDSENPKAFLRISKEKCSEIITSFFKNSANKMRQNTIDNKYTVLISKEYIVSRDSLYSNHNKPYIIQSGIKMDSIKNYYKNSESYNSIEGIYKSKDENENSIYTLGILKSSNHYNIICLDSNLEHWWFSPLLIGQNSYDD